MRLIDPFHVWIRNRWLWNCSDTDELHPKSAKEEIVREIQALQAETVQLEEAIKNAGVEVIISSLKRGDCPEIISRIKQDESYDSIA